MVSRLRLTIARWKQGYKTLSKRTLKNAYIQRKRLSKAGATLMIVGILGNLISLPMLNNAFADAPRFSPKVMRVWDAGTSTWVPDAQYDPGITFNVGDTVSFRALARNTVANTRIDNPTLKIAQATVTDSAIEVTSTLDGDGTPGAFNDKVIVKIANAEAGKKYKLEFSPTYQRNHCTDATPIENCPLESVSGNTASLLAGTVIADEIQGAAQYSILWNGKIVEEGGDPTPNPNPGSDQTVPLAMTLAVSPSTIEENTVSKLQINGVLQNNTDVELKDLALLNAIGINTKDKVTYGNDLQVLAKTGAPTVGTVNVQQNTVAGIGLKPNEAVDFTYSVTSAELPKNTKLQFEAYVRGDQIDDNQEVAIATVVEKQGQNQTFTLTHQIKRAVDANYAADGKATIAPGETADVRVTLVNQEDTTAGYFLTPILTETTPGAKSRGLIGPSTITLNGQAVAFQGSRVNLPNLRKGDVMNLDYKYTAYDAASYPTNTTTFTIVNRGTNNNDVLESLAYATPNPLHLTVQKVQGPGEEKPALAIDSKIKLGNGALVDFARMTPGDTVTYHVFLSETSNTADIEDYVTTVVNADPRLTFQGTTQGPQLVQKGTQNGTLALVFTAQIADASAFAPGVHRLSTQFQGTSNKYGMSATTAQDIVEIVMDNNVDKPSMALELQVTNISNPAGDVNTNGKVYRTQGALPGHRIQFKATVTNNGNQDLTNVNLADVFPGEMTNLIGPINGRTAEFVIPTLAQGESMTFAYEGTPINLKRAYEFTNNASATADGGLTITSNNVTVAVVAPEVGMTHTTDKQTAKPGETVTNTVKVKNTSGTTATDVTVEYCLAEGLLFKEHTTSNGGKQTSVTKDSSCFTFTWGTLKPGEEGTVTITSTVGTDVKSGTTLVSSAILSFKDTVGNEYNKIKIDTATNVNDGTNNGKTSGKDANREGRVLGATTTPKTGAGTVGISLAISAFLTLLSVGGYALMKKAKSLDNLDLSYVEFA